MRSICRQALMALGLFCGANTYAANYPTTEQLRTAIGVAADLVQAEGLALEMQDGLAAGVTLPLMAAGLDLSNGACKVFYNAKPEAELQKFFDGIKQPDLPVWLSAIAVHEATHCIEQREVYVRRQFDKVLPPDFDREGMTVKGYLGVVRSGAVETWGEALADIASVLYLKRTVPDQWMDFAQGIMAMRRDLAKTWPSHDTSAWLKPLIAAPDAVPVQQNLFDAAFQLRRQFRPR